MLNIFTHKGEYFSNGFSLVLGLIWAVLIGLVLYFLVPAETHLFILKTSNENDLVHQSGLLTWEFRIVVECLILVIGALIVCMLSPVILFIYPILLGFMLYNEGAWDWKSLLQIPILVPFFAFLLYAPKKLYEKGNVKKKKPKPKSIIKKASEVTARHLNKKTIPAEKTLDSPSGKLEVILSKVESLTFNAKCSDRDVQMGLATIKLNCREAIASLEKGIDDIGNSITTQEVGKGLRLLWVNFAVGWIDIVKSKMEAAAHKTLTDILEQIKSIAKELEN